jgi:hypothetical protein
MLLKYVDPEVHWISLGYLDKISPETAWEIEDNHVSAQFFLEFPSYLQAVNLLYLGFTSISICFQSNPSLSLVAVNMVPRLERIPISTLLVMGPRGP